MKGARAAGEERRLLVSSRLQMKQLASIHPSIEQTVMCTPIRAVVFDLDGLMFDTEALFYRVVVDMLTARGRDQSLARPVMAAMIGRRSAEATSAFQDLAGLDEPGDALAAEARQRFNAEADAAIHPTPGLFVLLQRLEQRNVPRAVATSSRRSYAEGLLARHGLLDHFTFLLTAEDVSRGKPNPEIYQKAVSRFGLPAPAVLVLEDSAAGLAAARAAGTFAVGVPHEHSPAEGLRDAHLIVPRLDDPALLDILEAR